MKYLVFIKGLDYKNFTNVTFDSLFPDEALVIFTLELMKGAEIDETELLLQINNPCPEHDYKF